MSAVQPLQQCETARAGVRVAAQHACGLRLIVHGSTPIGRFGVHCRRAALREKVAYRCDITNFWLGMMDRLTSMSIFVRVVQLGGFAATAKEIGISATMVAKHVQALEGRLG